MGSLKSHGITSDTPKNLLFSAGTFYKNLKWTTNKWEGEVFGATNGGGKLKIAPEYTDAEVDGATVKVKGLTIKTGETATIESSMTEIKEGLIKECLHLVEDTEKTVTGYKVYKSKRSIDNNDYLDNIGFVGTLVDGRQVIVILENALVTSAFELDTKNKTQATYSITFECTATLEQVDLEHLPYYIYFPNKTV